jgi:nucleoside-diphosphate-sugar epimerase
MKILITGSNGIIGKQLLLELIKNYPDAEFIVVNRKLSTVKCNHKIKIQSVQLDLLTATDKEIRLIMDSFRPELCFHLAWDTSHGDYLNTPDNIKWEQISIILIDEFYRSGGSKFIGIGTSIEYDWSQPSPFHEKNTPLTGSKWLYGQSKLKVYQYLASLNNVSYLWCRVFFVFGPGQSSSRLVPKIINSALLNDQSLSMNLFLKRDYISTFEIAKQIVLMQGTSYSGPVNICSGKPLELGYIVDCLNKILKKNIYISPAPYQDNFEIESVSGTANLINEYYSDYNYSLNNFYSDMERTVNYAINHIKSK